MKRLLGKAIDLLQMYRLSGADYARWKGVKVGPDCRVLTRTFGSEPFLIEIGEGTAIASGVIFLTHDGTTWLLRNENGRPHHYARIRVGNGSFVGYGAILMPGIEIGDRAIVGAGSVVTRSVPAGTVVAGNPARHICTYEEWAKQPFDFEQQMKGRTHKERVLSLVNADPCHHVKDHVTLPPSQKP